MANEETLQFTEIKNGEQNRTYYYADDAKITVEKVVRVCVRPSGGHRLETSDGKKFIIAAGWLAIEVGAKEWSF